MTAPSALSGDVPDATSKQPEAIVLRPMRPDEFAAYLEYFIPDYAAEIASNYGLSASAAESRAQREVTEDLPLGSNSPGQTLLCITMDETLIGYFWIRILADPEIAFVADFHILQAHQGQGLGRQALAALEARLALQGIRHLRLRVAADNARALHLYKSGGFCTTGINMSKPIGGE